jgi:hypothetical protein
MRWPQGSPCLMYAGLNKPRKQVERYAFRSLATAAAKHQPSYAPISRSRRGSRQTLVRGGYHRPLGADAYTSHGRGSGRLEGSACHDPVKHSSAVEYRVPRRARDPSNLRAISLRCHARMVSGWATVATSLRALRPSRKPISPSVARSASESRKHPLYVQQRLACSVGIQAYRGNSQKPRSSDSRVAGNQDSEVYRQGLLRGDLRVTGP